MNKRLIITLLCMLALGLGSLPGLFAMEGPAKSAREAKSDAAEHAAAELHAKRNADRDFESLPDSDRRNGTAEVGPMADDADLYDEEDGRDSLGQCTKCGSNVYAKDFRKFKCSHLFHTACNIEAHCVKCLKADIKRIAADVASIPASDTRNETAAIKRLPGSELPESFFEKFWVQSTLKTLSYGAYCAAVKRWPAYSKVFAVAAVPLGIWYSDVLSNKSVPRTLVKGSVASGLLYLPFHKW